MKKFLTLCLALASFFCLHAETYTIVFRSGNADSTSPIAAADYVKLLSSATDNCVVGASTCSKIYAGKAGYGIKGGTSSAKGELTLLLDTLYTPSTLTIYAAGWGGDTASTKGISVCGQTIRWQAGRAGQITPYNVTLTQGLRQISIAALTTSSNRFYVQRIEFTCTDPKPTQAKLTTPYVCDMGNSALIDSVPAEEAEAISIEARGAVDSLHLRMAKGQYFKVSPVTLSPQGGDVSIAFTANYASSFADTLVITAQGTNGTTIRRLPIKASTFKYTPQPVYVDSSCMQISEYIGDYYALAEGLTDESLKSTLGAIIHCGVRYRYGSGARHTWDGFYTTDREENSMLVLDMYSNELRYFNEENPTASVAQFDIEHIFPKSWWGGKVNNAYQDLFHLVPADYAANRSKSNHAPGFVTDTTFWNGSFATGSNPTYPVSRVFCPADEYKGDFARAYFYIATCYGDSLTWVSTANSEPALAMTNDSYLEFQPWLQQVLLQWHRLDPVSSKETRRATAVNAIQGNRNPFIDYPDLVEYIWGTHQGQTVHFADLPCSFNVTPSTVEQLETTTIPQKKTATVILRDGTFYISTPSAVYTILGLRVQ